MEKGFGIYVLDVMSVMTFIQGVVSAQGILMVLGGLASLAAMLNHGYDFYKKIKNRNNV